MNMNELWAFYIIEGLVLEVIGTWLIAQPFLKYTKFRYFSSREIDDVDKSLDDYKTATDKISQLQKSNLHKLDSKLVLAHLEEIHALISHQSNIANIGTVSDKRFDKVVINYVTRGMIFIIGGFVLQVMGIVIQATL